MPLYEYACDPCLVLYHTRHGMNDPAPETCAQCGGSLRRVFSPPNLNLDNFASPTAAKYARISDREEMAREATLQQDYQTIWLPPPVKHNPWQSH